MSIENIPNISPGEASSSGQAPVLSTHPLTVLAQSKIFQYAGPQQMPSLLAFLACHRVDDLSPYYISNFLYTHFKSAFGYNKSQSKFVQEFSGMSLEEQEMNILQFVLTITQTPAQNLSFLDIYSPTFSKRLQTIIEAQGFSRDRRLSDLARSPETPIEQAIIIGNRITNEKDKQLVLASVAGNPNCSPDQLDRIMAIVIPFNNTMHKRTVLRSVAGNPNCSPDQLDRIMAIAIPFTVATSYVLGAVARNPNCSRDQLDRIMEIASPFTAWASYDSVLSAIASNSNCSSDQLNRIMVIANTVVEYWSTHQIIESVASNPNCSHDQLNTLIALAENFFNDELLTNILLDSEACEQQSVVFASIASNPNCSPDQLARIIEIANTFNNEMYKRAVLDAVASNPNYTRKGA